MNDYDQILCGHCRQTVQVPQDRGVERCQCGSYVYRRDISLDAVRQYVEQCEGPLSHQGKFTASPNRPMRDLDQWERDNYNVNGETEPKVGDRISVNGRYIENPQFNNITPRDIQRDTRAHFSTGMEAHTPAEFYAVWAAYDAALANMPLPQQDLQRKAEILELERLVSL